MCGMCKNTLTSVFSISNDNKYFLFEEAAYMEPSSALISQQYDSTIKTINRPPLLTYVKSVSLFGVKVLGIVKTFVQTHS